MCVLVISIYFHNGIFGFWGFTLLCVLVLFLFFTLCNKYVMIEVRSEDIYEEVSQSSGSLNDVF